jgi:aspartate ammonia-lyase
MQETRREKYPLGPLDVPVDAMYGVQTLRAKQNFPISGLLPLEPFVTAQIWIKKAAALTHKEAADPRSDAIVQAADEVLDGQHRDRSSSTRTGRRSVAQQNANEVLGIAPTSCSAASAATTRPCS